MAGSTRLGKPCTRDRRDHVEAEDSTSITGSSRQSSGEHRAPEDTCDCRARLYMLCTFICNLLALGVDAHVFCCIGRVSGPASVYLHASYGGAPVSLTLSARCRRAVVEDEDRVVLLELDGKTRHRRPPTRPKPADGSERQVSSSLHYSCRLRRISRL